MEWWLQDLRPYKIKITEVCGRATLSYDREGPTVRVSLHKHAARRWSTRLYPTSGRSASGIQD
jgi:hypothetical protein